MCATFARLSGLTTFWMEYSMRKKGKLIKITVALALGYLVLFNAAVYVQARTGHILLTKYPCLFYNTRYGTFKQVRHNVRMVVGTVTWREGGEIKTTSHIWPVVDKKVDDQTVSARNVLKYDSYYSFNANSKSFSDFVAGLELQKPWWAITTLYNLPPTFFMTIGSNT